MGQRHGQGAEGKHRDDKTNGRIGRTNCIKTENPIG